MAHGLTSLAWPVALARGVYDAGWRLAAPLVARGRRLRSGAEQRRLRIPLPRADLWLQAASAGEATLARELLAHLDVGRPCTALVTTNTDQGLQLLEQAAEDLGRQRPDMTLVPRYAPLDAPHLMERALAQVQPRLVVLLETELWPGLLAACRRAGVPVGLVNGRLRSRSLARYLLWPRLWRELAPAWTLAVSQADGQRFASLFGPRGVGLMDNIKFDRLALAPPPSLAANPLAGCLPPATSFVVLGSVRRQEEAEVADIIQGLRTARPGTLIGLFPRHMERLPDWEARLAAMAVPCVRRSALSGPAAPGSVLLADVFGQLGAAYALADAAFVGGSLAPLGGQNFLEPLACGVRPVIGPHWETFAWVGREVVDGGLVDEARDGSQVTSWLLDRLTHPENRQAVRDRFLVYVSARRGGTAMACQRLASQLRNP